MRIVSALVAIALLGALGQARAEEVREIEAQLLHLQLDLSGVRAWDGTARRWQPLAAAEPILVVNLWAVECAPCRAEFPQLRRMVEAWRDQPEVRFLFVSETLSEKELLGYWDGARAEVPATAPCQATDSRLRDILGTGRQPVTLILDSQRVVRHAIVGSIERRGGELATALRRLVALRKKQPRAAPRR